MLRTIETRRAARLGDLHLPVRLPMLGRIAAGMPVEAVEEHQRFGALTLAPARPFDRSGMPDAISPAWKPSSHRKTV